MQRNQWHLCRSSLGLNTACVLLVCIQWDSWTIHPSGKGILVSKVILDCVITPNHIDLLPKKVTLYRGTDISEFKKSIFGQSWTTKESVAHKFAYVHYKNQHWFKKVDRIILKTEYPRQFVYYASQEPEFEVAIDTSKISNVKRIK